MLMTMTRPPALSIGMPVFNAEPFLDSTLDSILQQSFEDFELIVVDNASTDATDSICRDRAAGDRRIRYVRNRENIGSRRNYNLAFELGRAERFSWARAHDRWHIDYLSKCNAILDDAEDVVLCHARCSEIDPDGNDLGTLDETIDTRGLNVVDRVRTVFEHAVGPAGIGVGRSRAMTRTQLYRDIAGCDILFLLELSAHGAFAFVDEPLVQLRRHRTESSEGETIDRTRVQMNPFVAPRRRPIETHILDFCRAHLQIIDDLQIADDDRHALESALIECYRAKFEGSFQRCAIEIDAYVSAQIGDGAAHGVELTFEALWLLDMIQLGLLFLPDDPNFAAAQARLLGIAV